MICITYVHILMYTYIYLLQRDAGLELRLLLEAAIKEVVVALPVTSLWKGFEVSFNAPSHHKDALCGHVVRCLFDLMQQRTSSLTPAAVKHVSS